MTNTIPATQLLANLTKKVDQLKAIVTALPAYSTRLATPATSWLTPQYITAGYESAYAFIVQHAAAVSEFDDLMLGKSTAKVELLKLIRASAAVERALHYLLPETTDTVLDLPIATPILQKADLTLQFLDLESVKTDPEHLFFDFKKLKEVLELRKTAFLTAEKVLTDRKTKLETEKQAVIDHVDAIDDLFHLVTATLSGVFHEEREILETLMPWRKRKTIIQHQVSPQHLVSEVLAALPDLADRISGGNIEINGTRTVTSEAVSGEFVVAAEELKPADFAAVAEGGFLSEVANLAISAVRFESGRLQFDVNLPADDNLNGASVTISSLVEPRRVVARAMVS